MIAYQGKEELKASLVEEMKLHREQDQIIKGTYGKTNGQFKGCAVGCSIHSLNVRMKKEWNTNEHGVYEIELGIPRALAYIEDRIFEGLPDGKAQDFAVNFLEAVRVGSDLRLVVPKFMVWLLADKDNGVISFAKKKQTKDAIEGVITLYKKLLDGKTVTREEWSKARAAAYAAYAADAAYAAAYAAAADAAAAAKKRHYEKMAEKVLLLIREAA